MHRRIRHCWLVLIGRIPIQFSPERMEFDMSLDNFNAAVADLQTAANNLIAKAGSDATALAAVQAELADVDAKTSAALKPITDSLAAAATPQPAPQPQPQPEGGEGGQ